MDIGKNNRSWIRSWLKIQCFMVLPQFKVRHLKLFFEVTDNCKWETQEIGSIGLGLQGVGKGLTISVQRLTSNDRHNKQRLP